MRDAGGEGADPGADGDAGVSLDPEQLGALMAEQLFDLLGSWTTMVEGLAQQGADPRPLLRTLGETMRRAADQLDPPST